MSALNISCYLILKLGHRLTLGAGVLSRLVPERVLGMLAFKLSNQVGLHPSIGALSGGAEGVVLSEEGCDPSHPLFNLSKGNIQRVTLDEFSVLVSYLYS
jgi:hypothetical protein